MTDRPLMRDTSAGGPQSHRAQSLPARQRPVWKRAPLSWAVGFVMFWYHFIVGDDWTLAAVVAFGLAVTALLHARGVSIWWLVPALVIAIVGIDLERASHRLRKR